MASQVTNYECPACMGPLHFVGTSGKLECDYCGGTYEVAEVEAMFKEKEERAAKAMAEQSASNWDMDGMTDDWGADAAKMKSYSCPSCGAALVCDENTAATCCPYCGNQTVVPGQFADALKPEFVIPFKTDKEQAIAALKKHYQGKKLLPKSFVDNNHIDDIQGIYVPFWMFDATAEGEMRFHATQEETKRQGNEEITTTKHFDVRRSGNLTFEKVPVDASTRMPDGHMDSIEPYDYSELKPFSTAYMPGFLADKYDVEAQECGKRMEERCKESLENAITSSVKGYTRRETTEKQLIVKKGDVHYAMLPVWLLATKWNDQNFLFAMNGQSGKLVGDLPLDKKKYWTYFGAWSAVFIAIMMFLSYFVFANPLSGAGLVVGGFLVPIFVAWLIVSGMKAQLRSISTSSAGHYIDDKGLVLTTKTDQFLRTTVSRKPINNGNTNQKA